MLTIKQPAFQQCDRKYSKQEVKHKRDNSQVNNLRNGMHQSSERHLEPFILVYYPQWPDDSEQSENLEELDLLDIEHSNCLNK